MTCGTVRSFRCGSRGLLLYAVCRTSFLSDRLKKTYNQNKKMEQNKKHVFFVKHHFDEGYRRAPLCNPTGQLITRAKGSLWSILLGASDTSVSIAGGQKPFCCPPSSSNPLWVSTFMKMTLSESRFTVSISESGVLQSDKNFIKVSFTSVLFNKTFVQIIKSLVLLGYSGSVIKSVMVWMSFSSR